MSAKLTAADLAELHQTIGLIALAFDDGEVAALPLVFTEDAVVDLGYGDGVHLEGLDELRTLFAGRRPGSPEHQTVNTVVLTDPDGTVRTRSRYVAVTRDGIAANGDYLGIAVRTEAGWRLRYFRSVLRNPPAEDGRARPTALTDEWRVAADRLPAVL